MCQQYIYNTLDECLNFPIDKSIKGSIDRKILKTVAKSQRNPFVARLAPSLFSRKSDIYFDTFRVDQWILLNMNVEWANLNIISGHKLWI